MKFFREQNGFTLVELLIVVAIIGILAAIAIPNFLRFQAKSKQAEVKANLGAMHTALDAFRSEQGSYTTDMLATGWSPSVSPRYNYGFQTDNHDPLGTLGSAAAAGRNSADLILPPATLTQMIKSDGTPYVTADLPASTVTATFYTFGAIGNLDNDATDDLWIMTSFRTLTNLTNDVGN